MKIKEAKTTIDFTGREIVGLIKNKIQADLGITDSIKRLDITYAYEKKANGKGYKKTDQIKRVRITL